MDSFNDSPTVLAELGIDPQSKRLLRLDFPRKDGPKRTVMLANTLDAVEEVSRDFTYSIEVLSNDASIPLTAIMGKMVTISLVRDDGSLRYFNGYVFEFRFVKTDGGFAFYHMVLKPWIAFLRLRQDNAVFQNLNILDLCDKMFIQHAQRDVKYRIVGEHLPFTLAVQYNETDHNHLHRRLEDSGLFYWYEHRADGHTLWLSDDSTGAAPIDGAVPEMAFQNAAGSLEDDGVHQWSAMRRIAAGRVTLGSHDFKNYQMAVTSLPSVKKHGGESELEIYESTGAYGFNHTSGDKLARLRIEEIEARDQDFVARSNDRTAQPGRWFKLAGHFSGGSRRRGADASSIPDDRSNRPYFILRANHRVRNNYQDGREALSEYENEFHCMRSTIPWRPTRGWNSSATRIFGVQTATVVGPPGEEIYTDEYGRVRLQFHWDRNGTFDAASSPWVRVVSSWAGSNFGQISVPRIEQEVVVQFLDGNCDRPLIIGSVYNSRNMPPWDLPACKTQSGILTRSTVGGGRSTANALRFEDKKGAEELWMHAEKDQRIEVEHDETHWVGNDRTGTVDRDETVLVKRDRTETVIRNETITIRNDRTEVVDQDEEIRIGRNRTERVGKNEKVTIRGNKTERVVLAKEESIGLGKALTIGAGYQISVVAAMNTSVGMSQTAQVGVSKHTRVGRKFTIDAGDEFSINVGACTFQMRSDGTIFLSGTRIGIESSGPIAIDGKDVDINAPSGGKSSGSGGAHAMQTSLNADPERETKVSPNGNVDGASAEGKQLGLKKANVSGDASALTQGIELQKESTAGIKENSSAGPDQGTRPSPTKAQELEVINSVADAPKQLVFSDPMQSEFSSLWGKSHSDGKPLEHGGVLVADANGDLSLVNAGTSGQAGEFSPDYNVPDGTKVMGVFHTHPYALEEGGHVGASLSGGDAAVAVLNDGKVVMAQSGESQFAFLRTKETPPFIDDSRTHALANERIHELITSKGMAFPAATQQVARETADRLKLAYYEGRNGVLTKVNGPGL